MSAPNEKGDDATFAELPGSVDNVVVRFPPEASGFLHIGHAKAALLNQRYQLAYKGKLVFRFDDTNPEKEKTDFEDIIRGDVKMLGIKPDRCSYTSDYFDFMIEQCEQLIKRSLAYVDDTPADQMKTEREQRVESKNRNNSVEKNLSLWEEMKKSSDLGKRCCVRAKIDMSANNGCLRDPTIFRCKEAYHPRTRDKYKVYPTYDFACPIVDSIEGVTHALRTTEYEDRDEQYQWFIKALGLREIHIVSYARLNMMNTVLSKRKLTWFVDTNIVDGWDDPRMPTVRGIVRRGMTIEGLKRFITAQGSSRSVVFMDWDKLWSFNKKILDHECIRLMCIQNKDPVTLNLDCDESFITTLAHPKRPELGELKIPIGPKILIEQIDAQQLKEGEKVTLMGWGNVKIIKINREPNNKVVSLDGSLMLQDKDYKKTLKISWLKAGATIDAKFVYYEHIITKPVLGKDDDFKNFINKDSVRMVDFLVSDLLHQHKSAKYFQFLKRGFLILDEQDTRPHIGFKPYHLISIPDGSNDLNIFPLEVQEWKKLLREEGVRLAKEVSSNKGKKEVEKSGACVSASELSSQIKNVGDEIRSLKSSKADKKIIDEKVKKLLDLKAKYKQATGQDWNPNAVSAANPGEDISNQIKNVGDEIRSLKSSKADKKVIDEKVKTLLDLKAKYKEATGQDWVPQATPTPQAAKNENKPQQTAAKSKDGQKSKGKEKTAQQSQKPIEKPEDKGNKSGAKKQTRLGIEAKKAENLADWYTEIITKSEMIEYYDISGCYILRPWAYSIWERIQKYMDEGIKKLEVENCYFPMFVSQAALEKEKSHIADFAPEVAWVTKSGSSDLAEPIAIRPTSETVMYPSFAKWVQSHRSLPIKINQWCNIVRWEFKNPTPFLRTREFLWQEGHTAFANREEAVEEVYNVLDLYASVYEHLMAVPVIKGRKSEKEKFAGGEFTTTIEAYVPANGRGIQAATSHHLGQNFSKMFEIVFEDPNNPGQKKYVFQNSWGLTTRSIGCMIMVHGDDKGLVLPPNISPLQIVIIACGITANTSEQEKEALHAECSKLNETLIAAGLRSRCDLREHYSPGWRYNHWELKGVPIRVEVGPKDLKNKQFVVARRDTGAKTSHRLDKAADELKVCLQNIHDNLFAVAKKSRDEHLAVITNWDEFLQKLDQKFIIMAPFCGVDVCEETIKKNSSKVDASDSSGPLMGAKTLCIPFDQPRNITDNDKCINANCKNKPTCFALFGRSY